MAQVFLSYASQDRARVETLARALEKVGFAVFWDRSIPPGETWRDVLDRELTSALCVVVVWSKSSVASRWVLEEAEAAKERLLPVVIEEVELPFGFRQQQAADLMSWRGDPDSTAFGALCRSIAERLETPLMPPRPNGTSRRPWIYVASTTLLLTAVVAIALLSLRGGSGPQSSAETSTIQRISPEAPTAGVQPLDASPAKPDADDERRRRVYFETFSEPDSVSPELWAIGRRDDWSGNVEKGEYHLCNVEQSSRSSYTAAFAYQDEHGNLVPQTNSSVMLTVRLGADLGNYSMAGVLFRADSGNSSYYALARSSGHSITLLRKEGQTVQLLSTWNLPGRADDVPVTIRVDSSRDSARLFVENKQIDTLRVPARDDQRSGVFAMGKGCFFFDDASLYLPRE